MANTVRHAAAGTDTNIGVSADSEISKPITNGVAPSDSAYSEMRTRLPPKLVCTSSTIAVMTKIGATGLRTPRSLGGGALDARVTWIYRGRDRGPYWRRAQLSCGTVSRNEARLVKRAL